VMFITKIAVEYDRDKSIYPLLTVYARNLARNAKWQRQHTPSMPDVNEQENDTTAADQFGALWVGDPEDVTNLVSRKIALEKVSALLGSAKANPAANHGLMPGVVLVQKQPPLPEGIDHPRPERGKGSRLSADQRELVEIRRTLCMTQSEFAEALNINVPRLSSWEYGRTKGVPAYYMAKARELLALGNRARQQGKALFEHKTMSEILAEWASVLQLDLEDTSSMASLLGVSEPTIRRWRTNEVKPSIANLVRYNALVQQLRKRLGLNVPSESQSSGL